MTRQAGQSMVEFAVAVSAFVLLALGTQLIARYHDIQRQAILAARQTAFTSTWLQGRATVGTLQQQVRELHLRHEAWRDPTGRAPLPEDDEAIHVSVTESDAPGRAVSVVAQVLKPLQVVGGYLGSGFDLSTRGFQRASVTVELKPLAHLPAPFDALALSLEERAAVLGDAWNASGPPQVRDRSAGLVPTSLLATHAAWLRPFMLPLALIEPAIARLCLGLIEPDFVPLDRLVGAHPGTPQPGQAGCR